MKKCVFCSVVKYNRPHHEIIWSDNDHVSFLDANPVVADHTLVIPKRHTDYIFDLTDARFAALFKAAKKVAVKLKRILKCQRVALVVEGFSVPHAHIHLLPLDHGKKLNTLRAHTGDPKILAYLAAILRRK